MYRLIKKICANIQIKQLAYDKSTFGLTNHIADLPGNISSGRVRLKIANP